MSWYKIMFEKWIKTTASEEYTNEQKEILWSTFLS